MKVTRKTPKYLEDGPKSSTAEAAKPSNIEEFFSPATATEKKAGAGQGAAASAKGNATYVEFF